MQIHLFSFPFVDNRSSWPGCHDPGQFHTSALQILSANPSIPRFRSHHPLTLPSRFIRPSRILTRLSWYTTQALPARYPLIAPSLRRLAGASVICITTRVRTVLNSFSPFKRGPIALLSRHRSEKAFRVYCGVEVTTSEGRRRLDSWRSIDYTLIVMLEIPILI